MCEAPVPSSPSANRANPGFWPSPFGAAEAVAATREFSELQLARSGLFWLEYDPASAVQRLCRWQIEPDGERAGVETITAEGQSVRSRVNEYGGGSFCVADDAVFFVDEQGQQIYHQSLDTGVPRKLTRSPRCRFGDLFYDPAFGRLLCVRETHGESVTQDLVAIDAHNGELSLFASGADFYASPRVNRQGTLAAWTEWSVVHMPWDRTRLATARLQAGTGLPSPDDAIRYMTPDSTAPHSILQPRFDAGGRLWCLSDHQGWWQLYRLEGAAWVRFDDEKADCALPPSQLGQQQYAFLPAPGVALTKLKHGWMHLEVHRGKMPPQRLLPAYSLFRYLQCDGDELYCIAGAPDRATAVLAIDIATGQHRLIAGGDSILPAADTAQPEAFTYPVAGAGRSHGFFYRPTNSLAQGKIGQAPVVVMTHGGPTSATYPVFNPMIQFWAQRGFAVADLNYRGSSGFGRAYRQALQGRWGISDVEDVLAALDELARRDWCDTGRAFIRGSSAGGFTTLSVLVAAGHRFLAGCSLYGVSDPWALRQATHRFESRYLDWLIAAPSDRATFEARSPLARARDIRTPVIFFQGGRDKVVVPTQTEAMVAALEAEGLEVSYHYFPDEGHGFRQPNNRQHALEQELDFFRRRLAGRS